MLRTIHVLAILSTISFSIATNYLTCSMWGEQNVGYSELSKPIIGFTETVVIGGETYGGWYIIEADSAHLLPFKAWFEEGVYIDGLEIGERFKTPRSEWRTREFMDYNNMEEAFLDLSTYAPLCITLE